MADFLLILEFIFRDFWTWLGTLLILSVIAGAPRGLINIVSQKINEVKEDSGNE